MIRVVIVGLCLTLSWVAWSQELQTIPVAPPAPVEQVEDPAGHSDDHGINTDRPHNAEAAYVMPPGWIQTESGGLYLRERTTGTPWTLDLPNLVRFGTGDEWEFRLECDTFAFRPDGGGFNDVSLGFKKMLCKGDVEIAVLARLFVPSGSQAFRRQSAEPDAKLCFSYELHEGLELEWNVGLALPADPLTGQRYVSHFLAANLTQELNQYVGIYGEIVSLGRDDLQGKPTTHFDGGLLFWINDDLQLDLEYYRGLSTSGIDWGLGFGLSTRW